MAYECWSLAPPDGLGNDTPSARGYGSLLSPDLIEMKQNSRPVACGGFGDLFMGNLLPTKCKVAMKRPRFGADDATAAARARMKLEREAAIWSTLSHTNVLKFIGLVEIAGDLYLVSQFMPYGNLAHFVASRRHHFNLSEVERATDPRVFAYNNFNEAKIIHGVAAGLAYMHSQGIIHGDIKGANVLLHTDIHPMLCDFGLSKLKDGGMITTTGSKGAGSTRWMSPELFGTEEIKTFASDVYALGMTITEVLTADRPFPELSTYLQVYIAVALNGERPPMTPDSFYGQDFTELWLIAEECWNESPADRPSAKQVLEMLESSFPSCTAMDHGMKESTMALDTGQHASTAGVDDVGEGVPGVRPDPAPDIDEEAWWASYDEDKTITGIHSGFDALPFLFGRDNNATGRQGGHVNYKGPGSTILGCGRGGHTGMPNRHKVLAQIWGRILGSPTSRVGGRRMMRPRPYFGHDSPGLRPPVRDKLVYGNENELLSKDTAPGGESPSSVGPTGNRPSRSTNSRHTTASIMSGVGGTSSGGKKMKSIGGGLYPKSTHRPNVSFGASSPTDSEKVPGEKSTCTQETFMDPNLSTKDKKPSLKRDLDQTITRICLDPNLGYHFKGPDSQSFTTSPRTSFDRNRLPQEHPGLDLAKETLYRSRGCPI